jgi:eukaryotic-like serine/threonine-protein kinase
MTNKIEARRELGRGGFCVVHEARMVSETGRAVGPKLAIKRLQPDAAAIPEFVARFQREARLLDEVLNHVNIISVVHRNVGGHDPYFVMLQADCNLVDELELGLSQDTDRVIAVFSEILEAMAYAHDQDVIHRDLKPSNVLLHKKVVKVSDFGLGKALVDGTQGVTRTNVWSGTEPYMAPEQFTAMKDTGKTADVFSLGKLFIEMATGEIPVVGVPNVNVVPKRYRYFVQRCCAEKPENRYANARQTLEAFSRILVDPVLAAPPEEELDNLVEKWWETPSEDDLSVIKAIDEHLRCHPVEEAMFTKALPHMPEDILDQYMDDLPSEFADMLSIFDEHVSGGLPFSYCDTVAQFYERIYRRADDLALRELILKRLVIMAHSHNRWFVRDRILILMGDIIEAATVEMARDLILANRSAALWVGENARDYKLPKPIADAFAELARDTV